MNPSDTLTIVGATGVANTVMPVSLVFEGNGLSVLPFNNPTALRVATGDFDGDGIVREFVVLGRARTQDANDLRAQLVVFGFDSEFEPPIETNRFFVFDPGILGNGFVAAADVDGDGDDDIIAAQIGGGRSVVTAQIHLSNGDGTFSAGASLEYDFGMISAPRIAAGDLDNDGRAEIVIAARTLAGARVIILDAENGLQQQGVGFTWTFGVEGYDRGAFVAVGEFDRSNFGREIVLGSNVGGSGRVDVVHYDGVDTATLIPHGRFLPFGDNYNLAIRVAVGHTFNSIEMPYIVAGMDRVFEAKVVFVSQYVQITQEYHPEFVVLDDLDYIDGIPFLSFNLPPVADDLAPFLAAANTSLARLDGGREAFLVDNIFTPTGTGNQIDAGATVAFVIDGNRLVIPPWHDHNNLYAFYDLSSATVGQLDQVELKLAYYANNNPTTPVATRRILDAGALPSEIAAEITRLTVYAAASHQDPIETATLPADANGQFFGIYFTAEIIQDIVSAAGVDFGTGYWVLQVTNNSGELITLNEWNLSFAYL